MRKIIKYSAFVFFALLILLFVFFSVLYHSADMGEPELKYDFDGLETVERGDSLFCSGSYLRHDSCGLWELYVEGSGQERGAKQGLLTSDLMRFQEDVFINQIKEIIPSEKYLGLLRSFIVIFNRNLGKFIPLEYRDEIAAMSHFCTHDYDAIGSPYQRQLNYHGAHDIGHAMQQYMLVGCSSFGTWDEKSQDDALIVGRNFDFLLATTFAKNKLMTFAVPDSGYRYASIGWAGMVGVLSGMNQKGLTVTINAAKGAIPLSAATPVSILIREILQYASNIEEAFAIARKRELFVSESILVGSLADNKAVIIEKTPVQTALYESGNCSIVCTNHFQSRELAQSKYNVDNVTYSDSKYRFDRLSQLIDSAGLMDYSKAVDILRNRFGMNGSDVGIANEMTVNQSICHHSVVFEPARSLMWVSTGPWQSGRFVCYDLGGFFAGEAIPFINRNFEVAADSSFIKNDLPNLVNYRKSVMIIRNAMKVENIVIDDDFINRFIASNPRHYYTYRVLGDYFDSRGMTEKAVLAYNNSLKCEIPYLNEREEIIEKSEKVDKMIIDPAIQFADSESILQFQNARLREEIDYAATHSPFYQRLFARHGINPASIKTIDDLKILPVTKKDDLQRFNSDFIAVPARDIIDYVTTSGTLGEPVTFALTESDLERLAYNESLSFSTAGCSPNDIIQLMTTIDKRFMAGLAYFWVHESLGAGIVRVGNGISELQWDTIRRVNPSVCVVVPSFLTKLTEFARHNDIDYMASSLRKAICIGEPLRTQDGGYNALGAKLSHEWPTLELFSTYASTEMQSSFTECSCHAGGHTPVDLIVVELLDDNDNPVREGEPGEVTITTLGVRGMPLVRFKTGDICIGNSSPCSCGRNTLRLSSVLGRKGQMIKFKGTTLYPPALYDILDNVKEITNYIIEVYTGELGTDQIVIKVGSSCSDEFFEKELKDLFRSKVRVAPEIIFEPVDYIAKKQMPELSRKQIKFIDLR